MIGLCKRVCSILLVIAVLITPVFAAEMGNERASNFFWSSSVYLHKTSGTTFQVWFEVDAVGMMDEIGACEIEVQRSHDGVNWTTMRTYFKENNSSMIDTNTGTHSSYVTYTGTAGYYYRAYVVLYAKNSTGIGEMPEYTSSIKL